ncbi:disulfide bond formation protein B [Microvirga splendida]|nr:disulfide bond formation protein B [Microvirga splendida]
MSQTATTRHMTMPDGLLTTSGRHTWAYLFAAWIIALAATGGALFIGEVMGQTPCHLCWYQRIFMFPLAVILAVATFREDAGVWRYALPVAALGWLVAAFHSLLYAGIIPEAIKPCGQGPSCSSADMTVLGLPLPYLSLAAFTAIAILLAPIRRKVSNV